MPLRILWGDVEQPTANKWSRASQGYIPNTWEWTAQHSRASQPAPCPASFASAPHPLFFGGQTEASAHALMWQWPIGNADYDLIDTNRPGIPITR